MSGKGRRDASANISGIRATMAACSSERANRACPSVRLSPPSTSVSASTSIVVRLASSLMRRTLGGRLAWSHVPSNWDRWAMRAAPRLRGKEVGGTMHRLTLTPEDNAAIFPMVTELAKAYDTIENVELLRRAPVLAQSLPTHLLEFLEE